MQLHLFFCRQRGNFAPQFLAAQLKKGLFSGERNKL
jgi:hypothetical protein